MRLTLHTFSASDFTLVHNHFIEHYMISANGEFVKIYLYLLRCSAADREVSLSSIADTFNHTENDVKRALAYWEKLHLLKLTYDAQGSLTDITFTEGSAFDEQQKRVAGYADALAGNPPATNEHFSSSGDTESTSTQETVLPPSAPSGKFAVSPQRKKELADREEIRQLLFVAEQYLGKTLSSTEVNHILYFYDELHFSADLIEYLIEYSVSKGKKSISYIRKVALEWAAQGIASVMEAKKDTSLYHKDYYTILNAFGIKGRGPAQAEIELMARWIYEMGFSIEMILEACRRTINRTHTPNFQYADKILNSWKEAGIHHVKELKTLDRTPKASGEPAAETIKDTKSGGNRFNNFPQRTYDFDQLEQQLLDC